MAGATNPPRAEPPTKAAPPQRGPGYVYFIQAEAGGPVKIGWALDPGKRVKELQTGHPETLVVRASLPGTITDEAALHRRFQAHRIRNAGEWFTPTQEMADVAGCQLPPGHQHAPARGALVCDTCRAREATHVDLRPYATWGATAHLLCDACESEGYWLRLSEWNDPSHDWRGHLRTTKNGGDELIATIEERLEQKDPLP